jgi:site-specific recombinase XerD
MKYERNKAGLPPMPDLVIPDEFFPFSYRTLHRLVQQAGKLAGIKKHTHPHLLRHTFATTLTTSKVDLNAIRKLLGHADIKTTTRYADSTDPVLVEAVNQLPHG